MQTLIISESTPPPGVPAGRALEPEFFDRDARTVARALLGKVVRHRVGGAWLAARIIETEAYYRRERGSHASLGRTPSREPLFMPPGTIYMYYARGGDSLNFSCRGAGNAVLVKAGFPWFDALSPPSNRALMQRLNPGTPSCPVRQDARLCSGQTLLCRSLGLKVREWSGRLPEPDRLRIEDVDDPARSIVQTTRLGIPAGRDEHLPYRFIDGRFLQHCTRNPVTRRGAREGVDYRWSGRRSGG